MLVLLNSDAGWCKLNENPNPDNAITINVTSITSVIFFDFSRAIVSLFRFFSCVYRLYIYICICKCRCIDITTRTVFPKQKNTAFYGNKNVWTAASATLLLISIF